MLCKGNSMEKKSKKNSASDDIKEIAKQLLLKDSGTEFIGATPNYLGDIAIKKAKKIYEAFKYIDSLENLDESK